jgi:hypothetical protein
MHIQRLGSRADIAWGRVRGKHAQQRHGCMHRNLGALIAWQQRDVVEGGTEHGYKESLPAECSLVWWAESLKPRAVKGGS